MSIAGFSARLLIIESASEIKGCHVDIVHSTWSLSGMMQEVILASCYGFRLSGQRVFIKECCRGIPFSGHDIIWRASIYVGVLPKMRHIALHNTILTCCTILSQFTYCVSSAGHIHTCSHSTYDCVGTHITTKR